MSASFTGCRAIPFTGTRHTGIVERILWATSAGLANLALWTARALPARTRVRALESHLDLVDWEARRVGDRVLVEAEAAGYDESIHENDPAVAADLLEYHAWRERNHRPTSAGTDLPDMPLVPAS